MRDDADGLLRRMLKAAHEQPYEPGVETAPLGFASRVAAQWARQAGPDSSLPLWERWCGRAAMASAMAAILAGWMAWQTWTPLQVDDEAQVIQTLAEQALFP